MPTQSDKKPAKTAKPRNSKKNNYDKPDLRETIKETIMAGDKGGKPGQWSARKAQLLTHEYEKAGGGYLHEERTESQQHLKQWTDEQWQTDDGKPADRPGGTTRYLPKEAWNDLSADEKKATKAKKQAGSRTGKQVVANTKKAKAARKKTSE